MSKIPRITKSIGLYGINHQTMFPDLDGLSKYRNWKSMDFAKNKGLKPINIPPIPPNL